MDEKIIDDALDQTLAGGDLVKETIEGQELIFLPSLKRAEEGIAARIREPLLARRPFIRRLISRKRLVGVRKRQAKIWPPASMTALKQALTNRALVITGGPGVGKTTLVNAILLILRAKKVRCLLVRPDGSGGQTAV